MPSIQEFWEFLDIEYDFFRDGRFKLRVFNRAKDYDPLSESLGYEQGFGETPQIHQ